MSARKLGSMVERTQDAKTLQRAALSNAPVMPCASRATGPDSSETNISHDCSSPNTNNFVLVLDRQCVIRAVIESPQHGPEYLPRTMQGRSVDDIWPGDAARLIRDHAHQALGSRQLRNFRLHVTGWGRDFDFIVVVQGRDRVMLIARDVSDAEERKARLEAMAFNDEMTGLPNRDWLIGEIDSVMGRIRLQGGRAAVICLDIGDLDVIANATSQTTRDSVLHALADRLKASLRGPNTLNELADERHSAIARLDANRFAVLLPYIEAGQDAAAVTERLVERLEEPVGFDGHSLTVQVAAGIALHPQDGNTGQALLGSSITAVEDAVCSNSRRQKFHSGTVRMHAVERQDLELELQAALQDGEFVLAYQPIVTGHDRSVSAIEALLRWPRPLFGAKAISEVIAVAEYTGLIVPIGEWVFAQACAQLRKWRDDGHEQLQVAINVSAQEFAHAGLAERIARIAADAGVEPSGIIMEVSERLLFRDSLNDYGVCRSLTDLGVNIAVDDYGTGACSFDHLSRSPVNSVKIHPNIVARSEMGGAGRAACAAVTAMAHALDISVTAEGVETEGQASTLAEIGCNFLQGYLFGKPVGPAEVSL